VERNIRRLGQSFVVAFAILSLALVYWQVIRAPELAAREDNPRATEAAIRMQRGRILDRNGQELVTNQVGRDGYVTRIYADPAFAHVTGFASIHYGKSGIERAEDAVLTGSTPFAAVRRAPSGPALALAR
jgi:peptidoglycan glycosyltransferase